MKQLKIKKTGHLNLREATNSIKKTLLFICCFQHFRGNFLSNVSLCLKGINKQINNLITDKIKINQ